MHPIQPAFGKLIIDSVQINEFAKKHNVPAANWSPWGIIEAFKPYRRAEQLLDNADIDIFVRAAGITERKHPHLLFETSHKLRTKNGRESKPSSPTADNAKLPATAMANAILRLARKRLSKTAEAAECERVDRDKGFKILQRHWDAGVFNSWQHEWTPLIQAARQLGYRVSLQVKPPKKKAEGYRIKMRFLTLEGKVKQKWELNTYKEHAKEQLPRLLAEFLIEKALEIKNQA